VATHAHSEIRFTTWTSLARLSTRDWSHNQQTYHYTWIMAELPAEQIPPTCNCNMHINTTLCTILQLLLLYLRHRVVVSLFPLPYVLLPLRTRSPNDGWFTYYSKRHFSLLLSLQAAARQLTRPEVYGDNGESE